jgi:hypothetical protein
MSRGYGAVQRRILAALAANGDWTPLTELAQADPRDRSRYESALQAIHALRDAGAVETVRLKTGHNLGRGYWRLYVRLRENQSTGGPDGPR